ncbi:aspartate aminotransferase, mitochondrial-like [Arachis stenosperma]|uniref:aspartate aminotransferase, mitochondrial-like n=1 Tax=Arachis stenosperma TaxID=217475 RepID=UPI0025AC32FE|nr:aspartate aminotransferase, mitochondrial-like [Arachis stenosperma]
MYSNPSVHGTLIVSTVLGDPKLKNLWLEEVKIGMFCYSWLTSEQANRMTSKFFIYMTCNDRISMAGLNTDNVRYVANPIHEVTKSGSDTFERWFILKTLQHLYLHFL